MPRIRTCSNLTGIGGVRSWVQRGIYEAGDGATVLPLVRKIEASEEDSADSPVLESTAGADAQHLHCCVR
jgi:hypothetical protein